MISTILSTIGLLIILLGCLAAWRALVPVTWNRFLNKLRAK